MTPRWTGPVTRTYQALRERLFLLDVVLVSAVPAVLLYVFRLSPPTRQSLAFEYLQPSVWTAYTASFVHFNQQHLLFNLVGYGLVGATLYLLDWAGGERWRFRVVFVALFLACPVPLSYLNLAIDPARDGLAFGFSGLLMALYGYLPLSLASYLDSEFGLGRTRRVAPLLFFLGLAVTTVLMLLAVRSNPVWVAVDGVRTSVNTVLTATLVGLLPALFLVVLWYGLSVTDDWTALRRRLGEAIQRMGHFELAVVGVVLLVAVPVATFPIDPTRGRTVYNLFVHFVGFALGFISSYLYAVLDG